MNSFFVLLTRSKTHLKSGAYTALILFLISSCGKCPEQPAYLLCPGQEEWIRPAGEKWIFLSGQDTVHATVNEIKRISYIGPKRGIAKKCYGPLRETATQFIQFEATRFSVQDLEVSFSNTEYPCGSPEYGWLAKEELLPFYMVGNISYARVVKKYREAVGQVSSDKGEYKHNIVPDTIWVTKEKGVLKAVFRNESIVLERL